MTDKDGGPAFPTPDVTGPEDQKLWESGYDGMSLRQWYKGQALLGLACTLSPTEISALANGEKGGHLLAKAAGQLANAAIAEDSTS